MSSLGSTRASLPRQSAPLAAAATLLFFTGCGGGPSTVRPPSMDPGRAGRLAMEEYDTNGDGVVAGDELASAPGLNAALATLDTDNDGGVSADEVAARVQAWKDFRTGITTIRYQVFLNGRPLPDADVTFEPESFLGDRIQSGVGRTDASGVGTASIPKANRPTPQTPPGIALGLYKVRVSKLAGGQETIPARYNKQTVLGQQVSPDDPAVQNMRVLFELSDD